MSRKSCFISVGQFPPPVNGYTYITSCVTEKASSYFEVVKYDISAPKGTTGIKKHAARLVATVGACLSILKLYRNEEKVCYIGCEGNLGIIYTILVILVARLIGAEIYLHHHNYTYIDRPYLLMKVVNRVFGAGTHVFLCRSMKDAFERTYNIRTKSEIISNAAFVPPQRVETGDRKGPIVIGLLSNLNAQKGLFKFLDLVKESANRGLHIKAVLAGPVESNDDLGHIQRTIEDLDGKLEYLGPIYGEKKARFYQDIDVFIFPTEYANEAQPTVIFEAIASGCKVVSYDRGSIAAQVVGNGLSIDRRDPFVELALNWIANNEKLIRSDRHETVTKYEKVHKDAKSCVSRLFFPRQKTRQNQKGIRILEHP